MSSKTFLVPQRNIAKVKGWCIKNFGKDTENRTWTITGAAPRYEQKYFLKLIGDNPIAWYILKWAERNA